jgi:DNA polymerase-3 subunit delta'
MSWNTVIGQERVKAILRRAVEEERVAHAYLLWGPAGTGKDALAIEFARVLLCEKHATEPCEECSSCRRTASLQHPNLRIVFALPAPKTENEPGDVKSDVVQAIRSEMALKAADPYHPIQIARASFITVNSIRELRRETSLAAFEGGRKVFILCGAETMHPSAANALLKILEEPPADTVFLLTTSRRDQLLPTIISRCQSLRCEALQDEEISLALRERYKVPVEQAYVVARLANGNYARAGELLSDDVAKERDDAVQFLRDTVSGNAANIIRQIDEQWKDRDRSVAEQTLSLLMMWLRDAFLLTEDHGSGVLNADQRPALDRFVGRFGSSDLTGAIRATEHALELVRRNVYLPLIFISLSIQLKRILLNVRQA